MFTITSCECTGAGHQESIRPLIVRLFSVDSFNFLPASALLFKSFLCYLPERILWLLEYFPAKQLRMVRRYMRVTRKVASKLLDDSFREIGVGQSKRQDVMSLMGAC